MALMILMKRMKLMTTYKSLDSLKKAILKEIHSAVADAAQESKNVLQNNVDEFYTVPEGRYHRIGMLQAAPQLDIVFETTNGAMAQVSINTGTQYDPAGRDTESIYAYAEDDGLIGKGHFWERSKEEVPKILKEEIEKRLKVK